MSEEEVETLVGRYGSWRSTCGWSADWRTLVICGAPAAYVVTSTSSPDTFAVCEEHAVRVYAFDWLKSIRSLSRENGDQKPA